MKRLSVFAVVVLAGCVPRPDPLQPPPPTRPVARPAPIVVLPPVAWEDRARSAGDWSYGGSEGATAASFGPAGVARFALRCDQVRRSVTIAAVVPPGVRQLRVDTTSLSRALTTTAVSQVGTITAQAILTATDPLLDAMIYSRGTFRVSWAGGELIVPAWPELNRVVDDCRR